MKVVWKARMGRKTLTFAGLGAGCCVALGLILSSDSAIKSEDSYSPVSGITKQTPEYEQELMFSDQATEVLSKASFGAGPYHQKTMGQDHESENPEHADENRPHENSLARRPLNDRMHSTQDHDDDFVDPESEASIARKLYQQDVQEYEEALREAYQLANEAGDDVFLRSVMTQMRELNEIKATDRENRSSESAESENYRRTDQEETGSDEPGEELAATVPLTDPEVAYDCKRDLTQFGEFQCPCPSDDLYEPRWREAYNPAFLQGRNCKY